MKTISRPDADALGTILNRLGFDTGGDPHFGPMWRKALGDLGEAADAGQLALVADYDTPGGVISTDTPRAIFEGIIDINHNNPMDLAAIKTRGIAAVVHKASEGLYFTDPLYRTRKAQTLAAGLLWGAYHFAAFGNGADQAKRFLAVEDGMDPRILLALDYEPSSGGGPNMTLQQARDFVTYIHDHCGRWPVVYGGGGLLREAVEGKRDPVLSNCPLWLADYLVQPQTIAPTWADWTLLQFKEDKDRAGWDWNRFRGSVDDLRAAWPLTRRLQSAQS